MKMTMKEAKEKINNSDDHNEILDISDMFLKENGSKEWAKLYSSCKNKILDAIVELDSNK
jgi:hypothetical protein